MKKIYFTIIVLALCFQGFAQETPANVVKINPLGLLFGSFNATYERAVSEHSSLNLSLGYSSVRATVDDETTRLTGFGIGGGYRYYFSSGKVAPDGWYVGPNASYASMSVEEAKITASGVGALAGHQWVFDSHFDLDLFFGLQYASISTEGDISGANISGILPQLGLALGFAF